MDPVRRPPSTTGAFNKLPIELNWNIAHLLESDKDICAFRLVCRQTCDAIEGNNLSFWREQFRRKYAYVYNKDVSNAELKKLYQQRTKRLKIGVTEDFAEQGHGRSEIKLFRVLRDLVVESYQGTHGYDGEGRPLCRNQERLIQFILNSRNFLGIRPRMSPNPKKKQRLQSNAPNPELTAVQVMCAQLLFQLQMDGPKYDIYCFDESQRMVYAHHTLEPIFKGHGDLQVNMEWILHCMNFFRHHMIRPEAQSLYETMSDLEVGDRPSAWRAPLKDGSYPLSKHWKGTYSYLDPNELYRIRSRIGKKSRHSEEIFVDKNIEEGEDGQIQQLELDFVSGEEVIWPPHFESRLQSLRETMDPRTRAQHRTKKPSKERRSIRVQGKGLDQLDHFYANGWLNPLAPQQGIPGWQRVTFMKHFEEEYDQNVPDKDDLWAYEGVVLPGGRLMFGRWWFANADPDDPSYGNNSGPFILWSVDNNDIDVDILAES